MIRLPLHVNKKFQNEDESTNNNTVLKLYMKLREYKSK